MANDEEVLEELGRLREQYQQLGQITIELLGALDVLIKRGDARGSVGPKDDKVWYRAKAALARATGEAVTQPPADSPDS